MAAACGRKPTKLSMIMPMGFLEVGEWVRFVMIKDSKAYIVGSICMDMLMVDVNLNVKKVMRYLFLGKSTSLIAEN
jgi:alanine racemase